MSENTQPGKIRNILQSVQNRDVIKQASDIVVYIDGADYLINYYLGEAGVAVAFNDYVNNWQSSYSIDAMIPNGSLTLTVPVQDDYLFRSPGGNYLLNTMAEIRVFAKGYYFSASGNTVYHQIFKGFITSISYANDGTLFNIALSCQGSFGMLEKMQTDQNPSDMSSSPLAAMPYTSTAHNLNPYKMLAFYFVYSSMIDGFQQYGVQAIAMEGGYTDSTGHLAGNPYYEAVEERYVAKWQSLLYDMARDVHIFGSPNVADVIADIRAQIKPSNLKQTPQDKDALSQAFDVFGTATESDAINDQAAFLSQLREYLPDMGFASIQLFNGNTTSRLERIRYIVGLIGYEAYQDVDGGVIIKPPLYNLDVVNLRNDGSEANVPKDAPCDQSLDWITESKNPFVIQQSEILNEQETEDEAGVRLTRVTARGSLTPSLNTGVSKDQFAVAEDIDIGKLAQFGLRIEPPLEADFIRDGDNKALYAYAASKMASLNRGFRYYSVTIPMRPEIKLGFPVYFPHKDIYGYVQSVTMSWNRGSAATTTVMVDSLRRRPLFPVTVNAPSTTDPSQKTPVRLMTQSPNLVLQFTKASEANKAAAQSADTDGKIASLPTFQKLVIKQNLQMQHSREVSGLEFSLNSDSATNNWRVQPDTKKVFSSPRILDDTYYDDVRRIRPYTDAKGYELIGPFPWGRWKSLKDSLTIFTIANPLYAQQKSTNPALQPVSSTILVEEGAKAFLFTGDSNAVSSDTPSTLLDALNVQRMALNSNKTFELDYSDDPNNQPGPGSNLSSIPANYQTVPTPDVTTTYIPGTMNPNPTAQSVIDARTQTMLTGTASSPSLFESISTTVPANTETGNAEPLES